MTVSCCLPYEQEEEEEAPSLTPLQLLLGWDELHKLYLYKAALLEAFGT